MGAGSHLTSLLFSVNHEYGTAAHINAVIDIPCISYGVSCICVGAAHLLMNVNDVMERTTERKRDGGYFGVTHDRFYGPRGVHRSGEYECMFTHPLHRLMHDMANSM